MEKTKTKKNRGVLAAWILLVVQVLVLGAAVLFLLLNLDGHGEEALTKITKLLTFDVAFGAFDIAFYAAIGLALILFIIALIAIIKKKRKELAPHLFAILLGGVGGALFLAMYPSAGEGLFAYLELGLGILAIVLLFVSFLLAAFCRGKKEFAVEPEILATPEEPAQEPEPEPTKEEQPVKEEEPIKEEEPVKEEPKPEPVKEEPVKEEPVKEEPKPTVEEKPAEEEKPVKETKKPEPKKQAKPEETKKESPEEMRKRIIASHKERAPKEATPVAEIAPEEPEPEPVFEEEKQPEPEPEKTKTLGRYEVFPEAGFFKFRLKANNGQILIVSNSYKTIAGAVKGIDTLKKNVEVGSHRVVTDKNGYGQFRIFTANDSRLVVAGEIYPNADGANKALNSVLKFYKTEKVITLDSIPESEIREWPADLPAITPSANGKIELFVEEEKWLGRLLASNGHLLFLTTTYSGKNALLSAIYKIREQATKGAVTIVCDKQGRYQYKVFSDNGMVLVMGETYPTKENALSSAASMRNFLAGDPKLIDLSKAPKKETLDA
ncbi:MAG: DUF1508 domain-containing protein [Bacilli bacterium]|nr:DUF1508 domain-containing protein [Bacilli bacterium]